MLDFDYDDEAPAKPKVKPKAKPKKVAKKKAEKPVKVVKNKPLNSVNSVLKAVAKKTKKVKPKVYKVSGSFTLDDKKNVLKHSKAIHSIVIASGFGREALVSFVVKTK